MQGQRGRLPWTVNLQYHELKSTFPHYTAKLLQDSVLVTKSKYNAPVEGICDHFTTMVFRSDSFRDLVWTTQERAVALHIVPKPNAARTSFCCSYGTSIFLRHLAVCWVSQSSLVPQQTVRPLCFASSWPEALSLPQSLSRVSGTLSRFLRIWFKPSKSLSYKAYLHFFILIKCTE